MTCWSCGGEAEERHFCPNCGKILPLGIPTDHFRFMGLERHLNIDGAELEKRFYSMSRLFHPDYYQNGSEGERRISLELTSSLNDAYRTLKDPLRRAEYLIRLENGAPLAEVEKASPELAAQTFEIQEELEKYRGLKEKGDPLACLLRKNLFCRKEDLKEKAEALQARLFDLFSLWDEEASAARRDGAETRKEELTSQMKGTLQDLTFVRNFINRIDTENGDVHDNRD